MRVLNRIVRITDDGLLYEADPRHAELLAKSLNLENCNKMVTPGVKIPFDTNSGPSGDDVDDNGDTQMVNEVWTKDRVTTVRFNLGSDIAHVPMQSDIYGTHPIFCV